MNFFLLCSLYYIDVLFFLIAVSLSTCRHSNEEFILSNVLQIAQINTDFLDLCGLGDLRARGLRWWRRSLSPSGYAMSNIVSELSQIPDFQSRWLRGGENIGFISYYMLLAERMTYSCTTIRLRLYNYIGYGCTTLELWLYNYKGLSCTTAEFWFFDEIHELR